MLDLQEQSALVADKIRACYDEIKELETTGEFQMVKIKTLASLERLVNELVINSGRTAYIEQSQSHNFDAPLTVMMGRKLPVENGIATIDQRLTTIANEGTTMNPPASLKTLPSAEDVALQELQATVDRLYIDFPTLEPASILDTYNDIEIRSVAKKAGLPVTERNPKNITVSFIDKIKAAMQHSKSLEEAGNAGSINQ